MISITPVCFIINMFHARCVGDLVSLLLHLVWSLVFLINSNIFLFPLRYFSTELQNTLGKLDDWTKRWNEKENKAHNLLTLKQNTQLKLIRCNLPMEDSPKYFGITLYPLPDLEKHCQKVKITHTHTHIRERKWLRN